MEHSTLFPCQADFQLLFQSAPGLYLVFAPDFRIVAASDAYLRATMTRREDLVGCGIAEVMPPNHDDPAVDGVRNLRTSLERVLKSKLPDCMGVQKYDLRKREPEGARLEERFWSLTNSPVLGPNEEVAYIIHRIEDVTELVALKEQGIEQPRLRRDLAAENIFPKMFRASPDLVSIITLPYGQFLEVNEAFLQTTGFRREEAVGHTTIELQFWTADQLAQIASQLDADEFLRNLEIPFRTKSGECRVALYSGEIIEIAGAECALNIMKDVTEPRALETQLHQAQKMEAIGKLSGGIAHDFNNLLSVILGFSETLEDQLANLPDLRRKAGAITKAGRRAADLTRQLLAFSRRQVMEQKIFNLNGLVEELQDMLKRLIGEDVELSATLQPALCNIRADRGQIGQVIMNLVVNARDAMPDGGKLMIETANVVLDAEYARQHPPLCPASYVLLSVTDTGAGMTAETQARVFEPFFTTKEMGKGTGLGLATVYGVVKQCGGFIWVYSEVGHGTTFKIYFPQVGESILADEKRSDAPQPPQGSQTILLVEDHDALRNQLGAFLADSGYTVLSASGPAQALEISRHHQDLIHLVLSDVIMPGMNGATLADEITSSRPGTKVLLMSGYPGDSVTRRGMHRPGTRILQKPIARVELLRCLRDLLEPENLLACSDTPRNA